MHITVEEIKIALSNVVDPNTKINLLTNKNIKNIHIDTNNNITFDIELGYPAQSQIEIIRNIAVAAVQNLPGSKAVQANVYFKIVAHEVQRGIKLKTNVKNIIVIASGKGGVGKSTTAVNIALALVAESARVGILDADIYGPSQPMMLGIKDRPKSLDGKTMEPLENYNLQVSSIGFIINQDEPIIWRGPIVTQALQQLLNQTNWDNLDYLVIDMPPGTGDIQLTLAQKIPVTGAVIITTPQDIALLDVNRSLKMFEKVGIPILGIIENMNVHICSNCGHAEKIFGNGGAKKICTKFNVDFLGAVPLIQTICTQTDSGCPTVVADPHGQAAQIYKNIARKIAIKIAAIAKDMTNKFPNIVIQK